jgi:hypothetical protein
MKQNWIVRVFDVATSSILEAKRLFRIQLVQIGSQHKCRKKLKLQLGEKFGNLFLCDFFLVRKIHKATYGLFSALCLLV